MSLGRVCLSETRLPKQDGTAEKWRDKLISIVKINQQATVSRTDSCWGNSSGYYKLIERWRKSHGYIFLVLPISPENSPMGFSWTIKSSQPNLVDSRNSQLPVNFFTFESCCQCYFSAPGATGSGPFQFGSPADGVYGRLWDLGRHDFLEFSQ